LSVVLSNLCVTAQIRVRIKEALAREQQRYTSANCSLNAKLMREGSEGGDVLAVGSSGAEAASEQLPPPSSSSSSPPSSSSSSSLLSRSGGGSGAAPEPEPEPEVELVAQVSDGPPCPPSTLHPCVAGWPGAI
jgi:hypothetical protein